MAYWYESVVSGTKEWYGIYDKKGLVAECASLKLAELILLCLRNGQTNETSD